MWRPIPMYCSSMLSATIYVAFAERFRSEQFIESAVIFLTRTLSFSASIFLLCSSIRSTRRVIAINCVLMYSKSPSSLENLVFSSLSLLLFLPTPFSDRIPSPLGLQHLQPTAMKPNCFLAGWKLVQDTPPGQMYYVSALSGLFSCLAHLFRVLSHSHAPLPQPSFLMYLRPKHPTGSPRFPESWLIFMLTRQTLVD